MRKAPFAMAFGLAVFGSATARAQPRRASRLGCSVAHFTLAQLEGDGVDPGVAPLVTFTANGALAAWRERSGALRVRAFDAQWRALGPAREVARPAGAFAVAVTATGAALAYVERGHDVVLARVNARAEAQNVPRRVAREDAAVEAVALARTDEGMVVVWSAAEGRTLRGAAVDNRAVARGRPVDLGAGRSPRLAWLPSVGAVALTVAGVSPGDDATVVGLSSTLEVSTRLRWPALTLGPIELAGALHGVQVHGTGAPVLMRVPPGGAAMSAASDAQARARYALLDAAVDGSTAIVLLDDARGARLLVARTSPDGAPAVLTPVRSGALTPASLAVRADGVAVVARREAAPHGASRVVVSQVTCAR